MSQFSYPDFTVKNGYLTERIRLQFIQSSIAEGLLPDNAHRMPQVISLVASTNPKAPIHFWQLYSVLGPVRIQNFVRSFYQRVFADDIWFSSVFAKVGGIDHHVNTQSSMWIDVMGGGPAYHGGEYRLHFHHTHNAMDLMNDKGADRWVKLMVETLNDPMVDLTEDPRVRPAIHTFLSHFMGKYAEDFKFINAADFGLKNPAVKRRINFLNLSSDAIESLSVEELKGEFEARGIDVSQFADKKEMINKALSL